MISIIIPTDGVEHSVVATLAALVPGAAAGLVREVILVERGNASVTERIADTSGARFIAISGSYAAALDAGARQARAPWLMFLHPGAVLDNGWIDETNHFMKTIATEPRPRAAVFRYARSPYQRYRPHDLLKSMLRLICGSTAEQGLLISRRHYDALGGFDPDSRKSRLRSKLRRGARIILRTRITVAA